MSRRKKRLILAGAILGAVALGVLIFVLGFRVTAVKVVGNKFYTDHEIEKMILDTSYGKNSILAGFIRTEEKTKDANMISQVTVERENRNTIVLRVKEKQLIGCVEYQGQYVNFDRQAIVQVITDEPVQDVPKVEGLEIKNVQVEQKLQGVSSSKLDTILSVGKMLEKTAEKPDRLKFGTLNQLVLYYGSIEVRMGQDENMEEKMNRLEGILPQLSGMSGILYMENVDENSRDVVFEQSGAVSEEEGLDVQEDQEESGENQETVETSETDDPEQEESGNGEETDENGIDTGNTGLEYTDGSDSAEGGSEKVLP